MFLLKCEFDHNFAAAYYGLAKISEDNYDFATALECFNDYKKNAGENINHGIVIKIAVFSAICKKDDWQLNFRKWNTLFRQQCDVKGNKTVVVPVIGCEKSFIFTLLSRDDGLTVFCGSEIIYEYTKGQNEGRTNIGLFSSGINYQMFKFVSQQSYNPVRSSDPYALEQALLPAFFREYDKHEDYQNMMDALIKTNKLHLNHEFDEKNNEYCIEDGDIEVNLELCGTELTGSISIAGIAINIWVNKIGDGYKGFMEQLSKECMFNEAVVFITDHDYTSQLTFHKSRINVKQIY